ncbi:MAG TPA: hypothetical protein VLN73_08895, partial [Alphaproteobacteria bacterium]|nr:hypothetical protein [Alphaproteobacteria bacterium]
MSATPDPGPRLIAVTGADAKYFDLVAEQIASIRRLPEGASLALAVLDGGLEPAQVSAIEDQGAEVVAPDWPDPATARRYAGRDFLRINLAKPRLDQLFPGFDVIV